MKQVILGIMVGIFLGVAILFSVQYVRNINIRLTAIEQFLNNAICQAQQKPVAPVVAKQ